MIRKAKAVWHGSGRAGSGHLTTDSGVLAETEASRSRTSRTGW
jgi:osmotically inducible protein OsmC